jgi:5-formyltetrahydrofolate cyclo-ligase
MSKQQLRADMKAFLSKISPEERHARSLAACNHLIAEKDFKLAQMVMIFLSLPSEVETSTLAIKAWQACKRIAVPRVHPDGIRMDPIEISSFEVCKPGSLKGVREPAEGMPVPLAMIDIVVIPGMAFDRCGYRVGRGKGFYDRFLSQDGFKAKRCGFCFHEQLHDTVPTEQHDIPMDLIVTDQEVIHCKGK